MTTNCPDQLDEALIRPGRIDYQIAFSLATTTQIKELFIRMYMQDHVGEPSLIHRNGQSEMDCLPSRETLTGVNSGEDLVKMASSFAGKIPSSRLSPAVIQGYLLKYKDDPTGALRDVGGWGGNQLASIRAD
jgi:chaperone BCS1